MSTDSSTPEDGATIDRLPLMLTVEEAAWVLRIGRNGAYADVADGSLPAARIGRGISIPRAALARIVSSHGAGAADGDPGASG